VTVGLLLFFVSFLFFSFLSVCPPPPVSIVTNAPRRCSPRLTVDVFLSSLLQIFSSRSTWVGCRRITRSWTRIRFSLCSGVSTLSTDVPRWRSTVCQRTMWVHQGTFFLAIWVQRLLGHTQSYTKRIHTLKVVR
jgi:hypothetical protein